MRKSFHVVMLFDIAFLILLSFFALIEGDTLGSAVNGIAGYVVALMYILSFKKEDSYA